MRYRDEAKQNAVIEATVKLVNQIGFAATSTAKIAKEANVSSATIYIYYKNKEDLLVSTYVDIKKKMGEAFLKDFDDSLPIRDILKTALSNLTRHKARTALTTVGVVVGILTIVTMVSLGIGVQREMTDSFASVGLETVRLYPTTEEVSDFSLFGEPQRTKLLTPELVAALQARGGVVEVTPFLKMPNSVRMTARLDGQEVSAAPWGPLPAYVPDPFETRPKVLAGEEVPRCR